MMAKDKRADSQFCHTSSKDFANKINNATVSTDGTPVSSSLPVEASFASAAVAAPLIADTTPGGSSDAPGHTTSSCLAVMLGAALLAVLA